MRRIISGLIYLFLFFPLISCKQEDSDVLPPTSHIVLDDPVVYIPTPFFPYDNKIIAHRGAWKYSGLPENSISSLQQAIKLGCYGSEFDVHMAADYTIFINHDSDIQGYMIEKTSSSMLSQLKLSNGEPLPTLKAYIEEAKKQNRTRLVIEIKPSIVSGARGIATADKVVELVRAMSAREWVQYTSLDYNICKRVKALEPAASVAYLTGDKTPEQLAADHIDMNYPYSVLQEKESWIDEAQAKNVNVNSWTVNTRQLLIWFLLTKKTNFVMTDDPEKALIIK